MISFDKDALKCDLAETYGIYDYRSLPATTVATFSVGLRDDSRIKMKIRGEKVPINTLLLGMIFDNISKVLVYLDAIEDPKSLVGILIGEPQERDGAFRTFDDAESYEKERMRIVEKIHGRN